MLELFIAAWFTITPPQHLITDSTSVCLLEFQSSVSSSYLIDKSNYSIVDDEGNELYIYSAELLDEIDNIPVIHTKLVALVTTMPQQKKIYSIEATGYGVRTFYNNGYAPNLERQPYLIIKSPPREISGE